MKNILNNMRFKSKLIWIFGIMFFLFSAVSSYFYYQYTSQDIEKDFSAGAEDVMVQLSDTFDLRLSTIRQRAQGMLTNNTFVVEISDFLNNPSDLNRVRAMGTVSSYLKDMEMGERLIHSTYIYTDKGEFDNFVRVRNWEFQFEESDYYKSYLDEPGKAIRWFPTRKDEIFQGNTNVIPCVWRFSVQGYSRNQYLVIQLKTAELEQLVAGRYDYFDKILILDAQGEFITGSEDMDSQELLQLAEGKEQGMLSLAYRYGDSEYLVVYDQIEESGWQIFGLKSKQTLLGSLEELKQVILKMLGIIFAAGIAATLLVSHQLTSSLQNLEQRMRTVQHGDFDARFFYPYKDEVGSLAKSFNYMLEEIQELIEKQKATIEELKQERDHVAEIEMQKRKSELKALQAQINPHFLYNTLNAITWLAEDQDADQISMLSNSLGRFYRISLSKGAEVITLREELAHVKSYLDIQSIRYQSKLTYQIEVEEKYLDCRIIKLVLQPLAENAIYHGIKEKQGCGAIRIWARQVSVSGKAAVQLSVWDDGVGIPDEKLTAMNERLKKGKSNLDGGYGIYNVNERIRMLYGEEYGLFYESEPGQWTQAMLTFPAGDEEVESCIGL